MVCKSEKNKTKQKQIWTQTKKDNVEVDPLHAWIQKPTKHAAMFKRWHKTSFKSYSSEKCKKYNKKIIEIFHWEDMRCDETHACMKKLKTRGWNTITLNKEEQYYITEKWVMLIFSYAWKRWRIKAWERKKKGPELEGGKEGRKLKKHEWGIAVPRKELGFLCCWFFLPLSQNQKESTTKQKKMSQNPHNTPSSVVFGSCDVLSL